MSFERRFINVSIVINQTSSFRKADKNTKESTFGGHAIELIRVGIVAAFFEELRIPEMASGGLGVVDVSHRDQL